MNNRLEPVSAARAFVDAHYPDALCAFMTSSVLRGEGKDPLIQFAERALAPAGGRLFEGYRAAGPPEPR